MRSARRSSSRATLTISSALRCANVVRGGKVSAGRPSPIARSAVPWPMRSTAQLLELAPHDERVRTVVDGFLHWLFDAAERPSGWWPRASLANGVAKDPVFQLDQQLYPFLLLEDHARLTGEPELADRYATRRDEIIRALLARRTAFGLIAADETPADDPSEQPFHFSSHVLLWRVLRDLDPPAAAAVRTATLAHFTDAGRFAYAVRGAGAEGARH